MVILTPLPGGTGGSNLPKDQQSQAGNFVKCIPLGQNHESLRFMFGKEQLGYFLPLALFANMSSLNICGGDFYSDKLIDLLEQIGQKEKKHGKPIFLQSR